MSSSLRRGALAAAAIAFSLASLTACGAGNQAQTLEIKPDNAAVSVGDIKIQNAVVITQPDLESTGPAVVTATLFNGGPTAQTLESVKVEGIGAAARLKPAKGSGKLTIPAHGSLILGGKGNASAVLESSREAFKDGDAQPVTFTLSKTGDVKLEAFVVPAEHYFSGWGPTEAPTPSSEPSGSASESGAASGSPSSSPSGSASGESGETGEAGTTPTDAASASADASESAAGH